VNRALDVRHQRCTFDGEDRAMENGGQ
jgi:hypothetical protein